MADLSPQILGLEAQARGTDPDRHFQQRQGLRLVRPRARLGRVGETRNASGTLGV